MPRRVELDEQAKAELKSEWRTHGANLRYATPGPALAAEFDRHIARLQQIIQDHERRRVGN
jgi:hypothetical protein